MYEWNAHDYVIRNALEPDDEVERIIDEVDEEDDIESTELQKRY